VPVQHLHHPDLRHHPRGPKKLALADEDRARNARQARSNYLPAKPGALEAEPLKAALIIPAHYTLHNGGFGVESFLRLIGARTGPIHFCDLSRLGCGVVDREIPPRLGGGLRVSLSSMDDCRKCQTSTATPAEPGGLP
jgi:hypothetical protein